MSNDVVASKKTTSVSLTKPLVAEVTTMGINLSQASEEGVAVAVACRRGEQWAQENAAAIESYNEFVEKHGMVLDKYRFF